MIWYCRLNADGTVASAYSEPRPGYAEVEMDERDQRLDPLLRPEPPDPVDILLSNPAVAALVAAINDGFLPVGQGLEMSEVRGRIAARLK